MFCPVDAPAGDSLETVFDHVVADVPVLGNSADDAGFVIFHLRGVTFAADDAEQARDTASLSVSLEGRLTESFSASLTAGAQFGGGVNGGWGSANLVWKF